MRSAFVSSALTIAVLSLFAFAASGCGSDDSQGTPAATGGAGGSSGTGGAGGAGEEDAAVDSPDDAAPDAAVSHSPIWINAGRMTLGAQQISFANVWNTQGADDERCVPHMIGPCLVVDCRDTLGGDMKGADLGDITITPEGKTPVTLAPDTNGQYAVSGPAPSFAEGDNLTFTVAGGADLDAFEVQNLVIPAQPAMTSPAISNPLTEKVPVDPTQDFTVAWTGGAAKVGLNLQQNAPNGANNTGLAVVCVYDGSPGTGTVPAAVMSLFAPSSPSLQTLMAVTNGNGVDPTIAGWSITLWALNAPLYQLDVQ